MPLPLYYALWIYFSDETFNIYNISAGIIDIKCLIWTEDDRKMN